jgi:hypothetical protein
MRSRPGPIVVALLVGVVGCGSDGQRPTAVSPIVDEAAVRCDARSAPRDRRAPPIFRRYREVLLGCARTPAGTMVRLYAIRQGGGPCLVIDGLPGGARGCGRAPSERVPPRTGAIADGAIVRRTPRAKLELYGETAATVRRVVLRYRVRGGRPRERPATLIRAEHSGSLRAARIREPFGYFLGAVPPRARKVFAVALDEAGEELGRLGFDRLARSMSPTAFIAAEP